MKKIAFLSTYSLNEPVLKNRITPFIDIALERGFTVTLVNPSGGEYHQSADKNFRHRALNIPQANRGNFFVRTLREISLARKILKSAPDDVDVTFVTIPSMFLLFLFGRGRFKYSVLDVRDLTWEYLSEGSAVMRSAKRVFRLCAGLKVPKFNLYTVTNKAEEKYLLDRFGVSPERIILCPNGISRRQYEQVLAMPEPVKVAKNESPTMVYVGNVGLAQNLVTLVETAKMLPNFNFVIVGGGSDFERIQKSAKGVPNIDLKGRIDWNEVPSVYQQADILWAQLTPEFSGAVPSKLYEYLATGKPVIYGGMGEAVSVVSDFERVCLVAPEDSNELVAAIESFVSDNNVSRLSRNNQRKIADSFIRENSVHRFYEKLLSNKELD